MKMRELIVELCNKGISLKMIAKYSNINYTTLSKWTNGKRDLNQNDLKKIVEGVEHLIKDINKIMEGKL